MWKSTIDEQVLTFRLIGVNNQNFIMEDEQTGTWWQQVTGEAITGPLEGKRLEPMFFEQVTWELWSKENPATTVLESRPEFAELYWNETEYSEKRTDEFMAFPVEEDPDDELDRGELVMALRMPDLSEKAYPMPLLREQNPVADRFAGRDLLIVVAEDGRSVRAFDREVDGRSLEFYALVKETDPDDGETALPVEEPQADPASATGGDTEPGDDGQPKVERIEIAPFVLVDAETRSEWDFSGTAITGPLAGKQLTRYQVYADHWFDWKKFNPDGRVYTAGVRPATNER